MVIVYYRVRIQLAKRKHIEQSTGEYQMQSFCSFPVESQLWYSLVISV